MNWKELQLKLNDPDYVRSLVDPEKIIKSYEKVRELQKKEKNEDLKNEYKKFRTAN